MTGFLVDTSAWFSAPRSIDVRQRLAELSDRFLAATTQPVIFEVLTAAQDAREMAKRRLQLHSLHVLDVEQQDWNRAFDIYQLVADRGPLHHRQVARTDVLVAAVAERHRMTVLHYDQDFDVIAEVTKQPVEWIAPRGSLGD